MNSNRSRRDVVAVGGRAAGSATAMLLARLGRDVLQVMGAVAVVAGGYMVISGLLRLS